MLADDDAQRGKIATRLNWLRAGVKRPTTGSSRPRASWSACIVTATDVASGTLVEFSRQSAQGG
jgi:hypothetical protein